MHIDIRILVIRPTIINASESVPVFVPGTQLGDSREAPRDYRRLGLASLCRALLALAFWWVVISLCVELI
jgi:hypothetical protein